MAIFGSFSIRTAREQEAEKPTKTMRLRNRVYLTAEGKVVAEGDPSATELLFGAGSEVSEEDAKKYGLTESGVSGSKGETRTGDTAADSPQGRPIAQVEQEAAEASAKPAEGDDSGRASKAPQTASKARK